MPKIGIIIGSDSDWKVMQECYDFIQGASIDCEVIIASAHRTPDKVVDWVHGAEDRGVRVIIAAAGKAAHLPGVVAGHTVLPVIGVPMLTSDLGGVDSLYSIVQMPPGIPVATVTINGAKNAAILALEILASSDVDIRGWLLDYRKKMAAEVEAKNVKLQETIAK